MYNTREALAYSGKLPVQQNQAGVTPQLLDLLAMQKVDADKKAAAQALAMASGQANMPTVAQGIEQQALNSARGEIAQKLGLAGLAQQQAPQGPAPQMPPQQGLEGAPSALPQTYQEGGIVAFAKAGKVPEAEEDVYSPEGVLVSGPGLDKVGAEDMTLMERLGIFNRENRKANERADAATAARTQPAAPREVPAAARRDDRAPLPSLAGLAAAAPVQKRAPADKPEFGLAGVADASAAPPRAAPVAADSNSFTEMERKRLAGLAALDPEAAYKKGDEEYQNRIGAGLDRDLANQQARIAKRQELYDRQAAERDPSWLTGLQRMGDNVHALPGQQFQGVSSAISKAREGYTTQDIANQTAIDTLNDAMEKARQSKDIGGYNAAKGARDAIIAQKTEGGKETATMAGHEMQAASSKYTADASAQAHMAVAKMQERAADNRLEISERRAASQELAQAASSIDKDLKDLETDKKLLMELPSAKNMERVAELNVSITNARNLKQQIMQKAYGSLGATTSAAPTIPKVGEVRGGYTFKGGDPALQSSWTKN